MLGGSVAADQDAILRKLFGESFEEYVHAGSIATGHDEEKGFNYHRLQRAVGIAVLPDMVAGEKARPRAGTRNTLVG